MIIIIIIIIVIIITISIISITIIITISIIIIDKYLSQRGGIISSSSSLQSILQLYLHRLLTILQQTQSTR